MQETNQVKTVSLTGSTRKEAFMYPMEYQDIRMLKYLEKGYLAFWGADRHLGLMDARGRVILSPIWEDIRMQADSGVIYATKNGRTVLFNMEGKPLLGKTVEELLALDRGTAVLGPDKNILILEQMGGYFDGLARGRKGSTTYHILPNGHVKLYSTGILLGDFHCGRAICRPRPKLFQKTLYGYCDKSGKKVILPTYSDVDNFSEDLAAVLDETGRHYIRPDGTKLETYRIREGKREPLPPLHTLQPFQNGYAAVLYMGKTRTAHGPDSFPLFLTDELGGWGILDKDGRLTTPKWYNELIPTPEAGIFLFSSAVPRGQEKRYGMINARGDVLLREEYRKIVPLDKGLFAIIADKVGVADKTGRIILEPVWESVSKSCGAAVNVKQNGLWGLKDLQGNSLLPTAFTSQIIYTGDLALADREGTATLLNPAKTSALPEGIVIRHCPEAGLLWVRENECNYLLDYGFQP